MTLSKNGQTASSPEVISLGMHVQKLNDDLDGAPYKQPFTPFLVDAGILPPEMGDARLIPGVTYGIHGLKPKIDKVELISGESSLVAVISDGTASFNPHRTLRSQAHELVSNLAGKGKDKIKGNSFGLASYIVQNQLGRHLFIGGEESDLDLISEKVASTISDAYEIGCIVVGGEVVTGQVNVDIGKTSLPALIREIGQNIIHLDASRPEKVRAINDMHRNLQQGKETDYRKYGAKGKPTKK